MKNEEKAKDKKQLDEFRKQLEEKPDYELCELGYSVLNSIETKMNLEKNLKTNHKNQTNPKI